MYKNNKYVIILPVTVAVAIVLGILAGHYTAIRRTNGESGSMRSISGMVGTDKVSTTVALIKAKYVDPVDMDTIAEKVIPEILKELDPHSVYIPLKEMSQANEALDGEFDGIGVVFNMATDTVRVLNVIAGGPSEKAGVRDGDRIIKINDTLVAGQNINQNDIVKKLRGKRGTTVKLDLERAGISSLVPVTVERGVIPIKALDAAFLINPTIGYIKLSAFSRNSHSETVNAMQYLRQEGMRQLIFDLRGNSGGFLDQATLIANEFLGTNQLMVYTVDNKGNRVEEFSNGKGRFTDTELVILIDEASASSSEILAGAIQDNDRGTIIGRRSFGKGLVQQQFPYADGSAIRLTIARYYTPTGRSIQKPYENGVDEYNLDLRNRYDHNELFSADSITFNDSLRFTTPKGKVVYGGGGIMPDIFVPLDTTGMSPYFVQVSGKNILYRYTIEYTDRHRTELDRINTVADLKAFLDRDTRMLEDFVSYAARNGVAPNRRQIEESKDIILAQIRAYVGRNTKLQDSGFYSNIYPIDNVILRAIAELNSKSEE